MADQSGEAPKIIVDSEIGAGSRVWFSVLEGATVGQRTSIGPFSHLRPGAVIEDVARQRDLVGVVPQRLCRRQLGIGCDRRDSSRPILAASSSSSQRTIA